MNKLKSNMKRVIALFFVLITLFNTTVIDVFAGDTVFLQSLIDISTNKYQVTPVGDSNKAKKKLEYKTAQINKYVFKMCDVANEHGGDTNRCYDSSHDAFGDEFRLGTDSKPESIWIASELMATSGKIYLSDSQAQEKADAIEKVKVKGGDEKKLPSTYFFKNSDRADYLPLSWPSDPELHSAGNDEINYATTVASTLSNSLNSLINLVNGGKKIENTAELMAIAVALRPNGNKAEFGNYILHYKYDGDTGNPVGGGNAEKKLKELAKSEANKKDAEKANISGKLNQLPTYDADGNLYVYIYPKDKPYAENTSAMIYAMPKGYRKTNGGLYKDKIMFTKSGKPYGDLDQVDSAWVNIHMLSQYANAVYKANGTTAGNVADADEGNVILNMIINFIQNAVNGFFSLLGLKSTNELVYNRGLRGSNLFNFGTMSDNWWKIVLQYHLIFQAIAWFVIVCGFLKTCIDLNLSRMNPNARENAYDSIKRFLVVGFLLVLIIPLSQFMMSMNNSIVQIFATQVGDVNSDIAPNVKGIAGIIFVFAYGVIRIYINFVYIMRSITIALLLVSAPFFISVGAWSKNGYHNSLTTQWFKELTANIFMQSVHAFCLAFLINLMGNGSGLESFVISYSIIPITDMFRGLIFQGAGSSTINLGQQAADKGTKMAQSFARSAGDAALSGGAKLLSGKESKSTQGEGSSNGVGKGRGAESGAAAMNNVMNNKVSELKSRIEKGEGGFGAGAKIAALRGLQGAGKFAGAMAGFGTGMMNAELSGNSMGYSDAGSAVGSYVGGSVGAIANEAQDIQQRVNNKVSSGQKHDPKDDKIGSAYTEDLTVKNGVGKGLKAASDVNGRAEDAIKKIASGNGGSLDANERTSLAMRVAQNGTAGMTTDEIQKMKQATGFSNSSEAKEYLSNMGVSVSGGTRDKYGNDEAYSYTTGNKDNGSIVSSKMLSNGSEAVRHAIPKSNGAVASTGSDNSVNLTFNATKDGANGVQNFEAFAQRNSGAANMLSEMNNQKAAHLENFIQPQRESFLQQQRADYQQVHGNLDGYKPSLDGFEANMSGYSPLTSGQLSNGINWSQAADGSSMNLNYGRDYQRINNVSQMEVSNNGSYINTVSGNRNLSNLYTNSVAQANTPARTYNDGYQTSSPSPMPIPPRPNERQNPN